VSNDAMRMPSSADTQGGDGTSKGDVEEFEIQKRYEERQ
jgi:hypothetical protein